MSPSLREDVTEGKKVHGIFSPGSGIWPCNHCNQASMPGPHAEPYPSNPPLLIQSTALKLFRMSHPQIPTSMSLQDLLVPASLALKRKIFSQVCLIQSVSKPFPTSSFESKLRSPPACHC